MSIEETLRAELVANAPLMAVVSKISQNSVPKGVARPFIVFTVDRERHCTLDNVLRTTRCTFHFQVWGDTAASAENAADLLEDALQASALDVNGIPVDERGTAFDPDLDLEAATLTFDLWEDA